MYSGLSSAITPALLSPAEAIGSVAVPPSAEPSAQTPPPPPASRYRLDDFSRAQQMQQVQRQQQPFANGSDGRKRQQAFHEERRQPDKLDLSSIRGKKERKIERREEKSFESLRRSSFTL